jgi:hypothetical protein
MTTGNQPAAQSAEGKGWSARRRNQLAGVAAGVVVLAGGVLAFMPHQPSRAPHIVADDCGLVHCSASLPAVTSSSPAPGGTAGPGSSTAPAAKTGARPSAAASRSRSPGTVPAPTHGQTPAVTVPPTPPAPAPPPPPPPPPPSPPGPPVTVGYTVIQDQRGFWGSTILGRFIVVNHTAAAITSWTLQAGLPGDEVRWVSTSGNGWPWYPDWFPIRDGVTIGGPRGNETIPAHGTLVLYLSARGWTASLASCTFNGASC